MEEEANFESYPLEFQTIKWNKPNFTSNYSSDLLIYSRKIYYRCLQYLFR